MRGAIELKKFSRGLPDEARAAHRNDFRRMFELLLAIYYWSGIKSGKWICRS